MKTSPPVSDRQVRRRGSLRWSFALAVAVLATAHSRTARAETDDVPDPDGKVALAERFSFQAKETLRQPQVPSAVRHEAAALFNAAARLAPDEPRFARLLVDAELNTGDAAAAAAAVEALRNYRRLAPDDRTAQVQMIDLYVAAMQTADEKVKYLRDLLNKQPIPPEVRSAAAVRLARALQDRAQPRDALKALDTALTLNPLNVDALRMKYEMTAATATPMERVGLLLALARANPAQPDVAARLAGLLAEAGMVKDSIGWFVLANNLYARTGARPDAAFVRGAAAELFLAGQADEAAALLDQYLQFDPSDAPAWFTLLSVTRTQASVKNDDASKAAAAKALAGAADAMFNRFAGIRNAAGDATATTRPADAPDAPPVPDLSGDVDRLKKVGNATVVTDYIDTAQDLAWLEIYYRRDVAAGDKLLDVLGKLVDADDPIYLRLRGWSTYVAGQASAATTKLSAAADRDPYAALGLILIDAADPAKRADAVARGNGLLGTHPAGVVGATLYEALAPLGCKLVPGAAGDAIATTLNAFPRDWLSVLDQPQNFYVLRGEPLRVARQFGEPLLARVTIQNVGTYDLTIGDGGVLRPDVWFDVNLRGLIDRNLPGVAVDRIQQRLVLPAGQAVSQVVRLDDGGPLAGLLVNNPTLSFQMMFKAITNPTGAARPANGGEPFEGGWGPAGYRVMFTKIIERAGAAIGAPDALTKLDDALANGTGGEKVRTLELMQAAAQRLGAAPQQGQSPQPDARALAANLVTRIRKAPDTLSGAPRAWALAMAAMTADGPDAFSTAIAKMVADDDWTVRLLAARLAKNEPDHGKAVARSLSNDKDPVVKEYAAGALAEPVAPAPTTEPAPQQPAPAPATAPAPVPTTAPGPDFNK